MRQALLEFYKPSVQQVVCKEAFPVGIKRFAPLFAEGIDSTEKHGKLNKKISEAKGDKI